MKQLLGLFLIAFAFHGVLGTKCHQCMSVSIVDSDPSISEEELGQATVFLTADNDDTCAGDDDKTWESATCDGECVKGSTEAKITFMGKWMKVGATFRDCAMAASVSDNMKGACTSDSATMETFSEKEIQKAMMDGMKDMKKGDMEDMMEGGMMEEMMKNHEGMEHGDMSMDGAGMALDLSELSGEMCFCPKDECNGAGHVTISFMVMAVAVLAGLAMV